MPTSALGLGGPDIDAQLPALKKLLDLPHHKNKNKNKITNTNTDQHRASDGARELGVPLTQPLATL